MCDPYKLVRLVFTYRSVCVCVFVEEERRGEGAARVNGQVVICNRKCGSVCVCVSIDSVGYSFNNKINWL